MRSCPRSCPCTQRLLSHRPSRAVATIATTTSTAAKTRRRSARCDLMQKLPVAADGDLAVSLAYDERAAAPSQFLEVVPSVVRGPDRLGDELRPVRGRENATADRRHDRRRLAIGVGGDED